MKNISIVTVTYNAGLCIRKTLESVCEQKNEYIEFIIVDGKSTDDTLNIIKEYGKYIDILITEPDNGIYDAMNKGIAVSKGDFLYFLNAGDILEKDVLTKIRLLLNKDYLMIYGNVYCGDSDVIYDGEFNLNKLMVKNICHQSIFYNKKAFEKNGMYDLKYKIYADWVFNLQLYKNYINKIKYISLVISRYDAGFSVNCRDNNFTYILRCKYYLKEFGLIRTVSSIFYKVFLKLSTLMKW